MIMHPNCGLSTSSHYDTRDASGSPQNPHIGLIKWVAAITRENLTYMWVRGLAHLHPYLGPITKNHNITELLSTLALFLPPSA